MDGETLDHPVTRNLFNCSLLSYLSGANRGFRDVMTEDPLLRGLVSTFKTGDKTISTSFRCQCENTEPKSRVFTGFTNAMNDGLVTDPKSGISCTQEPVQFVNDAVST